VPDGTSICVLLGKKTILCFGILNPPKSSDSYFGFLRKGVMGYASAWAAAKDAQASPTPFMATYFSGSLK
jgi:hypothetical protein